MDIIKSSNLPSVSSSRDPTDCLSNLYPSHKEQRSLSRRLYFKYVLQYIYLGLELTTPNVWV